MNNVSSATYNSAPFKLKVGQRDTDLLTASNYLSNVKTKSEKNNTYSFMSSPASLAPLSAFPRSTFGSDPRNANHPLSISQLTSSHKKQGDKKE